MRTWQFLGVDKRAQRLGALHSFFALAHAAAVLTDATCGVLVFMLLHTAHTHYAHIFI